MTWVRVAIALPLGLAFGSFFTVAIHRVPAGESVVAPRSRCPECRTPIAGRDNVPVLSWLLLRGRCRACGSRIPGVYPLMEAATGALFVAAALRFEDVWVAVMIAPFLGLLLALSVIDIRYKIIPNRLIYPALLAFAAYIAVGALAGGGLDVLDAVIGFFAYGGAILLVAIASPRGMGMGDVKLAALIGLVLGAVDLWSVAVAAGAGILLGGLAAVGALLAGKGRKSTLPFGPFLAAGAAIGAFLGPQLAAAYLRALT
jgi:leader peptidase (prepilin peptidase)/N-methyltransferase